MQVNKKVRRQNISWLENNTHYINCAVFIDRAVTKVMDCIFEHCSFRDESLMIQYIENCEFTCCNFHILTSNFRNSTFHKCHFIEINTNYVPKSTLRDCHIKRLLLCGGEIDIESLTSVDSLVELSLENMQVENIEMLLRVDNLQSLDLRGVPAYVFSDDFARMQFSQLLKLDLSNTACSDRNIEFLKDYSSLQILNLGRTNVTSRGLKHLRNLHNLQSLFLNETKVKDLADLPALANLKFLNLADSDFDDYVALAKFPSLTHLDLADIPLRLEVVNYVKQLPNLKWLSVCIGDISIDVWQKNLPHLPYFSRAGWGRLDWIWHFWNG
ncbi:leucine-rich repeat domain-containing protein [Candidatus Uabimicrobium amorphum]|uniref:Adenylate cyclase n=1 Tax=Uabimicrobium amorphum TaxID=2596890 RepID=A0A5S9IV47_UABAM|nr:hypothetical protein [Candidatus Uabimicrobium amorphum]BBM88090.1 hypothetical protein UABAM_06506 [Candidatus Uabimicrobium amorphum]